jgi:hypothetical protein
MTTDEEVWVKAWTAVANSNSCMSSDTARNWADKCLKSFRERFPIFEERAPFRGPHREPVPSP